MPQPRKHHYLPQFYLRGFSANGRSVYQIEKDGLKSYTCSIADAAAIRDYHQLDYSEAKDSNLLEKKLADLEGEHSVVLEQTLKAGITSPELYVSLIGLVSLLRFRVPTFKTFIENFLREHVRSAGKIMEAAGELPPPPKGLEDILRIENLNISISNWKCLQYMFEAAYEPEQLNLLCAMTPSLIQAPKESFFLTCDHPFVIYHPRAMPTDAYGVGPAQKDVEISVPLSSQVLLQLSWNTESENHLVASPIEVEEFNRRTVIMADSFVFAPEYSKCAVQLVSQYNHCSAGFDFQTLDSNKGHFHLVNCWPVMAASCYPPHPSKDGLADYL